MKKQLDKTYSVTHHFEKHIMFKNTDILYEKTESTEKE
jgi:hypothetical protein